MQSEAPAKLYQASKLANAFPVVQATNDIKPPTCCPFMGNTKGSAPQTDRRPVQRAL